MKTFLPALLLLLPATAFANPEGYFVTVDDETEQPNGLVEFKLNDVGELEGFLRGSFDPTANMGDSCTTCPEELLGQPVLGLRIVYGLERDGERKFKSGRVVDPEGGKIYKAKVKYADDFETVELRGYVGTPLLGRTQTWRRASADELATIDAHNMSFGLPALGTVTP